MKPDSVERILELGAFEEARNYYRCSSCGKWHVHGAITCEQGYDSQHPEADAALKSYRVLRAEVERLVEMEKPAETGTKRDDADGLVRLGVRNVLHTYKAGVLDEERAIDVILRRTVQEQSSCKTCGGDKDWCDKRECAGVRRNPGHCSPMTPQLCRVRCPDCRERKE